MKLKDNRHYEYCECGECKPSDAIVLQESKVNKRKELDDRIKKWCDEYFNDPGPMIKKHGFDKLFYEALDVDEILEEGGYSMWHEGPSTWEILVKDFEFEEGLTESELDDDEKWSYYCEDGEPELFVKDENGKKVSSKYFSAIGRGESVSEKYHLTIPYWFPDEIAHKFKEKAEREYQDLKSKELKQAKEHEELLEFEKAAKIYKNYGMKEDVIRVRKLKNKGRKVVHGDTIIKDSVLNRSNVGSGGKSKAEEIKEIKELHDEGTIDDDEFKQMKKEILGK